MHFESTVYFYDTTRGNIPKGCQCVNTQTIQATLTEKSVTTNTSISIRDISEIFRNVAENDSRVAQSV
jgi:hypothetical protein